MPHSTLGVPDLRHAGAAPVCAADAAFPLSFAVGRRFWAARIPPHREVAATTVANRPGTPLSEYPYRMSALAQLLMRLLAMQMPCRLFCSASFIVWNVFFFFIFWAAAAQKKIQPPAPQIRSLMLYAAVQKRSSTM